jgi:hypothetical protein
MARAGSHLETLTLLLSASSVAAAARLVLAACMHSFRRAWSPGGRQMEGQCSLQFQPAVSHLLRHEISIFIDRCVTAGIYSPAPGSGPSASAVSGCGGHARGSSRSRHRDRNRARFLAFVIDCLKLAEMSQGNTNLKAAVPAISQRTRKQCVTREMQVGLNSSLSTGFSNSSETLLDFANNHNCSNSHRETLLVSDFSGSNHFQDSHAIRRRI